MVHRNIHTRKKVHYRLLYQIHGFSKQSTDKRLTCNIFTEEEYKQGNYQSHNGISTNSSPKESKTIEGSNHNSRTRIQVDQYLL